MDHGPVLVYLTYNKDAAMKIYLNTFPSKETVDGTYIFFLQMYVASVI